MMPAFRPATAAEVRELDRRAIQEYGIPGVVLMENAGRGAASLALELLAGGSGSWPRAVRIFCGTGNNGGDGFVVARHLANAGLDVAVALAGDAGRLTPETDAGINYRVIRRMGIPVLEFGPSTKLESCPPGDWEAALAKWAGRPALAVDALLGTGSRGAPRGPVAAAIRVVGRLGAPVLALDLPSGLDADTGSTPGEAVCANATASFALPKVGLLKGRGPALTGDLHLVDIGMPSTLLEPWTKP